MFRTAGALPPAHLCPVLDDLESSMAFDARLLSGVGVMVAVVEQESFARAADALGLTPSAVSVPFRLDDAHRTIAL
jgi:hypothetical protein